MDELRHTERPRAARRTRARRRPAARKRGAAGAASVAWIVTAAAVACALLVWLAFTLNDAPAPDRLGPERSTDRTATEPGGAPAGGGRDTAAQSEPRREAAGDVRPVDDAPAEEETRAGLFVEGRVYGVDAEIEGTFRLTLIDAIRRRELRVETVPAGREFLLDVTDLRPPAGDLLHVAVRLDHDDFMPAEEDGNFDLAPDGSDAGQRQLLVLEYDLRPAEGTVLGHVAAPPGSRPEHFAVALFVQNARGIPGAVPVHETYCDARGAFRLRSPMQGPHVVAAVEHQPAEAVHRKPVRPAVRVIELGAGADPPPLTLTFDPGEYLAGRVVSRDETPVAGVDVLARMHEPETFEEVRVLANVPVVWIDGRFELLGVGGVTDADGAFELRGLGPHHYILEAQAWSQARRKQAVQRIDMLLRTELPRVRASADGRELAVGERRAAFAVRGPDGPLEGVKVTRYDREGQDARMTDAGGRVAFGTDPRPLFFHFQKRGFDDRLVEFLPERALVDHPVTVEMLPGSGGLRTPAEQELDRARRELLDGLDDQK